MKFVDLVNVRKWKSQSKRSEILTHFLGPFPFVKTNFCYVNYSSENVKNLISLLESVIKFQDVFPICIEIKNNLENFHNFKKNFIHKK